MRKSVRYVSLFLAGLILLTTLIGAFASFAAYAAPTSSSGSSGSSSSEDMSTTGSLRLLSKPKYQLVDNDGELIRGEDQFTSSLQKDRTYRVMLNVLDTQRNFNDITNSGSKNFSTLSPSHDLYYVVEDVFGLFNNTSTSQASPTPMIADTDAYVVSNGGNLVTTASKNSSYLDPTLIAYQRGGAVGLVLIFYVVPDGRGRSMNLDVWYNYESTTAGVSTTKRAEGDINLKVGEAVLDKDANDDTAAYLLSTPNIIINSYNYGGQDVLAGSEFPLTLKFSNTSKELGLENIIMEITTSTDISIANGSNSTYIEKLDKGSSQTKTLQMAASSGTDPKPQQVTVKFSYEYIVDKVRKTGERTETLAIPIMQMDRFNIGEIAAPEQIWPGDNTYLTIDYVNKGKTEIANLSAKLETNIPGIGENQAVGNIKAGDSGTIDFTFTANDPGAIQGKVIITYEDNKGKEKTVEKEFSSVVMDMGHNGPDIDTEMPMPMPQENKPAISTIVMAILGALMVAGLTGTIVVQKIKAKREEEDDEDI